MKKPVKNLATFLAGEVGARVIGFGITVYLARTLDVSGFGVLNIGLAVLAYLAMVSSPGIQILETRNVAAVARIDVGRISSVLSLRLVLASILILWVVIGAFLVARDDVSRDVIILFSFGLLPMAVSADWFFQGKEDFAAVSFSKVINALVYGIIVVFLVQSAGDVRVAAIGFVCGLGASAVFLYARFRKRHGSLEFNSDRTVWKNILTSNLPVGIAVFFGQSVQSFPPLVIGYAHSTEETGMFSAAMKLIILVLLLDRGLNAIFLPAISRYFSHRRDEAIKLFSVTLRFVLVLAIPIAVIGVLLAEDFLVLIFGEAYGRSAAVFQVLLAFFVLTLANTVCMTTLIGAGRESEYSSALIRGTLVSIVAVTVLTLAAGIVGAAWGIVLGELFTVLLMGNRTHRILGWEVFRTVGIPSVAAASLGIVLSVGYVLDLPMAIPGSLVVYVSVLVMMGGLKKDDLLFLKEKLL